MLPSHIGRTLSRHVRHTRIMVSSSPLSTSCAHSNNKKLFKQIDGTVSHDVQFTKNTAATSELLETYNMFLGLVKEGGGEKARLRHVEGNKKVLAVDRLKMLFDDADDVLEVGAFTGLGMQYGNVPRAGMITTIGKIHGVHCLVISNDATVKGGTVFPIGVKKNLRSQEIAQQNRLPVIYVVDSGGAFLPLQAEIFTPGGRSFYNEAILNNMSIPQLAVVCGSCTAGAAYVPTMSQEALIVHKIGTIFLGGPPLVYAALGEVVTPEALGGGTMHSSISGCTDYFAETEEEAFETSRDIVATFNIDPQSYDDGFDEPVYDPEELSGIIPEIDQHTMDMYKVLARLVDGSRFHEFKTMFGSTLVCGFAFLHGHLVGLLGNNGPMTGDAAAKGAHFVQLCTQRNVPLVFLQNSCPSPQLNENGDIGAEMRGHAKLMSTVACSGVPKLTVIVGNSYGTQNFMMCGRSFNPRFVFVWPNAKTCIVEPELLIEERLRQKYPDPSAPECEEYRQKLEDEVQHHVSSFNSSGQLWDDGIIRPQDTRKVLAKCLDIVKQTQIQEANMESVIRM